MRNGGAALNGCEPLKSDVTFLYKNFNIASCRQPAVLDCSYQCTFIDKHGMRTLSLRHLRQGSSLSLPQVGSMPPKHPGVVIFALNRVSMPRPWLAEQKRSDLTRPRQVLNRVRWKRIRSWSEIYTPLDGVACAELQMNSNSGHRNKSVQK